jgi:hypothetical protein
MSGYMRKLRVYSSLYRYASKGTVVKAYTERRAREDSKIMTQRLYIFDGMI